MQEDFHHYAVYAIARAAGMAPDRAGVVAYASQHADDAIHDHALEFRDGGRFQQVLSAHKYFTPDALSLRTAYDIWVPFHFLPNGDGHTFFERMVVRPRSRVCRMLVDRLLALPDHPCILHQLGIALHALADTWSHQGFVGFLHKDLNNVSDVEVDGEEAGFLDGMIEGIKEKLLEYAAPGIGHVHVGTVPDEPFRVWRYKDHLGRDSGDIANRDRSLSAAEEAFDVLTRFLENHPTHRTGSPIPWKTLSQCLGDLFDNPKDLEGRIAAFRHAIKAGKLGIAPTDEDASIRYDDRSWWRKAIGVDKAEDRETYTRKPGFESSDWKRFHDALILHRYLVLREILPGHGLVCG